jgi:uncharacterized protein (DUF4415 family)
MPTYTSEELRHMSATGEDKTNWEKAAAIPNEDIDDSDLGDDFWKHAHVVYPRKKKQVTLRIDEDLLEWFRQEAHDRNGTGYQTIIHTVLASYRNTREQDRH